MATWVPISNSVPQFSKNAGGAAADDYYLKFYLNGTTTPTSMATDSTGGTLLDKCKINSLGYPVNGSDDVFIPHIDQDYKLVLYTNATDADNNATGSAAWVVDGLTFSEAPVTAVATLSEEQTAVSDGQALFTFTTISYTPGAKNLGVYRNGARLPLSAYTETSTVSITINATEATSVTTGDEFEFIVNERDVDTATTPSSNVTYTPAGTNASALSIATYLDKRVLDDVAALRAYEPVVDEEQVFILGHTVRGKGGGKLWHDASDSTTADNGVTVFVTPGGARWKRPIDIELTAAMGGAVEDGVTDDLSAIQLVIDAMPNNGATVLFTGAKYYLDGQLNLTNKRGFKFYGTGNGDGIRTVLLFNDTADVGLNLNACKGFEIKGFNMRTANSSGSVKTLIKTENACSNGIITQNTLINSAIALDLDGLYIGSIFNNDFGNNGRSIRTIGASQTVHVFIYSNVQGDHLFSTDPCFDISSSKTYVLNNSFECNSTTIHRIVHVQTGAQNVYVCGNGVVANTGAATPNACGGIKSDSVDTVCMNNTILGVVNIAAGNGIIEGLYSRIEGNTLSGDPASTVRGIRMANQLLRTVIGGNQFINLSVGIDFQGGQVVSVDNNTFSGTTQPYELLGENTSIGDGNVYEGMTTFGTFNSTTGVNVAPAAGITDVADGTTTPNVLGTGILRTGNTTPTIIGNFTNAFSGQEFIVVFNDSNTTVDFTGTNLKGNGGVDWTPGINDHMTVKKVSGTFYCTISEN